MNTNHGQIKYSFLFKSTRRKWITFIDETIYVRQTILNYDMIKPH